MRMARGLAGAVVALGLVPAATAQIVFGTPIESIPDIPYAFRGGYADLDGDGHFDLAFTRLVDHEVQLYFGDGRGQFGPATPTAPPIHASAIGFGDLDGDGHVELLAAPNTPGHLELQVWRGLGGAQFSGPTSHALAGDLPSASGILVITARDADGDADVDVTVVVAPVSSTGEQTAVTLLLNDGSGNLTPQVVVTGPPNEPFAIVRADLADLNADGLADAVYTGVEATVFGIGDVKTHLLLGQPGGTFVESQAWDGAFLLGLVDVNRDQLLDLVTCSDPSSPEVEVVTHVGLGGAQFAALPPTVLPITPTPETLADFDGDDVPDLLFVGVNLVIDPTWAVWPGDGLGGFDASKVTYARRSHFFLFAADTTSDGRLDIVEQSTPGGPVPISQVLTTPNWTYPASAPQLDLGHPQFGVDGWPGTAVSGHFSPNQLVTVQLWNVGDDLPALLVAGLTESLLPFKGGVMVPEPDALFGPISTGSDPILELTGRWPGGLPVGATLTLQWWIADPVAPQGMSASTAVRITQP